MAGGAGTGAAVVERGADGDWKSTGNLSGVAGDDGEKRRCRLRRGGGVSH